MSFKTQFIFVLLLAAQTVSAQNVRAVNGKGSSNMSTQSFSGSIILEIDGGLFFHAVVVLIGHPISFFVENLSQVYLMLPVCHDTCVHFLCQ